MSFSHPSCEHRIKENGTWLSTAKCPLIHCLVCPGLLTLKNKESPIYLSGSYLSPRTFLDTGACCSLLTPTLTVHSDTDSDIKCFSSCLEPLPFLMSCSLPSSSGCDPVLLLLTLWLDSATFIFSFVRYCHLFFFFFYFT